MARKALFSINRFIYAAWINKVIEINLELCYTIKIFEKI